MPIEYLSAEYLSAGEAAASLGRSVATVYSLRRRGVLHSKQILGRTLFDRAEVEALTASLAAEPKESPDAMRQRVTKVLHSTRKRQGLSAEIEDPAVIDMVVGLILDGQRQTSHAASA